MCGIAGILGFNNEPIDISVGNNFLSSLRHRGLDSSSFVTGMCGKFAPSYSELSLYHTRLAVLDLSSAANQPMNFLGTKSWIVFNGEIYNYKDIAAILVKSGYEFITNSDTEVILAAYDHWGSDCVNHFNGMFSFAIWDDERKILFCSRDPIGIKPFYYLIDSGKFYFSSESQSFSAIKKLKINRFALYSYYLCMYVLGKSSIFSSVTKLLPGHNLIIDLNGNIEITKYWDLKKFNSKKDFHKNSYANEFSQIISSAVRNQLISDVPIGAFLSGGIDSGIVASYAAESILLNSYSAGFDVDSQPNELPIARRLASRYGMVHHERIIESHEVLPTLELALAAMSEPVADSAIVPTYILSKMAASDGMKVMLSGAGGDEVFGGYRRYVGDSVARRLLSNNPILAKRAGKLFPSTSLLRSRLSSNELDMIFSTGGNIDLAKVLLDDSGLHYKYLDEIKREIAPENASEWSSSFRNMRFDLSYYLPDEILFLLDQLTMAHTLEGRVPLLDLNIVSHAFALDSKEHANNGNTKIILKEIAGNRLDSETFSMKKQGFSGPVTYWVQKNSKQMMERVLDLRGINDINNCVVDYMLKENIQSNNPQWASKLFSLYCFTVWKDHHMAKQ